MSAAAALTLTPHPHGIQDRAIRVLGMTRGLDIASDSLPGPEIPSPALRRRSRRAMAPVKCRASASTVARGCAMGPDRPFRHIEPPGMRQSSRQSVPAVAGVVIGTAVVGILRSRRPSTVSFPPNTRPARHVVNGASNRRIEPHGRQPPQKGDAEGPCIRR